MKENQKFEQLRGSERKIETFRANIAKRESWLTKINNGEIKHDPDPWNDTIRIGTARGKIAKSIANQEAHLGETENELYNQKLIYAQEYLRLLEKRGIQLGIMEKLLEEGNLLPEEVAEYREEYNVLTTLPERSETLRAGIAEINLAKEVTREIPSTEISASAKVEVSPEKPRFEIEDEASALLDILLAHASETNPITTKKLPSF
ncbi:MAG: hypothetical protein M1289_02955 [Patescibacteria group bacterium]|nr:hypothetical protein [Patescibacteria group bacterium]